MVASAAVPTRVLPSRPVPDAPATTLGATAAPLPDAAVTVEEVRRVRTTGSGPGETTGAPGAAVTVRVVNRGRSVLDLGTAVVDLTTGSERRPASPSDGPGAQPLPPSLAAGASATGTAVFAVPEDADVVRVTVRLQGGTPAAVFDGRLG